MFCIFFYNPMNRLQKSDMCLTGIQTFARSWTAQRCVSPFQRLANTKAHTSRFVTANLPCNKFKNRLVNIMPYETTRVCLQPIRGLEGSDYINASYIDGYRYASTTEGEKNTDVTRPLCFHVTPWRLSGMDGFSPRRSRLSRPVIFVFTVYMFRPFASVRATRSSPDRTQDAAMPPMIQTFRSVVRTCFDCSSSCREPDPLFQPVVWQRKEQAGGDFITQCACVRASMQATEGLHRHPRSTGWDYRGLLEDAVGTQLYYCGHAHQTEGDGTGEEFKSKHTRDVTISKSHASPSPLCSIYFYGVLFF